MMRKTITRTMTTSTIKGFKLKIVDGAPSVETLDPVTIMGNANEKHALKALREVYGKDNSITVGSIETSEETYEISVDDFMKYATKVDKNKNQVEETAN